MKLPKILHAYKIYRPDSEGGIPAVISTLTRDAGVSSSIVVARQRGLSQSYKIDGVPVVASASLGNLFSTPMAPTYPAALSRLSKKVDVVLHHAPFPLSDLSIAGGFPENVGLIVYWHADVIGRRFLKWTVAPFVQATLRRADRIVVSHDSMIEQSKILQPFAGKIEVVPFGTDTDYWSKLEPAQSARLKQIQDQFPRLVVFVGRLVGYKGVNVLIDAISRIDAQLVLIGNGPLHDALVSQCRSAGILDRVNFAGRIPRDDIKLYFHAAKVLALPSVNSAEAFGIVQIEAMAAGCPVVNTNLPTAVPHISRHMQEGLTAPVNDPRALALALLNILDNPASASTFSAAARQRALDQYNADAFRARMKAIYDDVILMRRRR